MEKGFACITSITSFTYDFTCDYDVLGIWPGLIANPILITSVFPTLLKQEPAVFEG